MVVVVVKEWNGVPHAPAKGCKRPSLVTIKSQWFAGKLCVAKTRLFVPERPSFCSHMVSLRPQFEKLLKGLPPPPANPEQLHLLVKQTLDEARGSARSENWKNQWEYLLRNEIFKLAVRLYTLCLV